MTASATLVLANHRPETIPLARRLMTAHDTSLLEAPPDKRFAPMLYGKIAVDDYLEGTIPFGTSSGCVCRLVSHYGGIFS